jgi:hypothetical protein
VSQNNRFPPSPRISYPWGQGGIPTVLGGTSQGATEGGGTMSFQDTWNLLESFQKTEGLKHLAVALVDLKLALLEKEYHHTQNGLFAWEALSLSIRNNLPLPPLVTPYFSKCADKLLTLESHENMAWDVCRSLNLIKEGKTKWKQYNNFRLQWKAFEMVIRLSKQKKNLGECFVEVASLLYNQDGINVSHTRVKKWYYDLRRTFKDGTIKGNSSLYKILF